MSVREGPEYDYGHPGNSDGVDRDQAKEAAVGKRGDSHEHTILSGVAYVDK